MKDARVDFALVQPLVYSLETWMAIRARLRSIDDSLALERMGLDGAELHLEGRLDAVFDPWLDSAPGLPAAFEELLAQASAYPTVTLSLELPASRLLDAPESWPDGLTLDSAETRLLLPKSGELVLVHVCSGRLDPRSLSERTRHVQREVRAMLMSAIASEAEATAGRLEGIVARALGRRPPERVTDVLEESGGHLVTFSRSTDALLVEALGRVHRVEEGTAVNQCAILLPEEADDPCYLHLGWSYSTVATPRIGLSYRLLFPLIAVNQAWYRYRELRGDVIDMSKAVDDLDTDRELKEQTDFYNRVVLQVKIWEAEREAFERSLKPVYRSAYDQLWKYWDTDESRATVHEGIDVTRDFLDRKFSLKIALRENTQSKILFVIAIFQLLSVFGLASSYLYFWEETRLPEAAIFGSEITVWITLLSPIAVLVLISWLLIGFLRRSR